MWLVKAGALFRVVRTEAVVAYLWRTKGGVGERSDYLWVHVARTSVILMLSKMGCP